MDFPLISCFIGPKEVKKKFKALSGLNIKAAYPFTKDSLLSLKISRKTGQDLTDYFSEECRVVCRFLDYPTPYEVYTKNIDFYSKLAEKSETTYEIFREKIYDDTKNFCSNFPLEVALALYRYFKPDKILDFSSGWGDRLIAAIAYGNCQEYQGVDPSVCMAEKYKKIVDFFGKKRENFRVSKAPFEKFDVKSNHYNLVFTSPPFFNLEIYENTGDQSVNIYKDLESWKKGFLFPSVQKSYRALVDGGYLALYVVDSGKNKYVEDLKLFILKKIQGFVYKGTIDWINISGRRKIRKIYVWKKED